MLPVSDDNLLKSKNHDFLYKIQFVDMYLKNKNCLLDHFDKHNTTINFIRLSGTVWQMA